MTMIMDYDYDIAVNKTAVKKIIIAKLLKKFNRTSAVFGCMKIQSLTSGSWIRS